MNKRNFEIACNVYKSSDHSMFKLMDKGNRIPGHVDKIIRSMKENLLFTVIFVNEKMEILDGQNRFLALKELGKPVYFIIIEGYGIKEARHYNLDSKNWSKKDFVKSYADEGKEDYMKIEEFSKMYPDFPFLVVEYLLRLATTCDSSNVRRPNTFKAIQRGLFEIPDYEKSIQVANMIMAYKGLDSYANPIYRRKEFASAIIKLSRFQEFNNDEVIRKIKNNPRGFYPCVNSEDYIRMIEDLLNYRRRGLRVRFDV